MAKQPHTTDRRSFFKKAALCAGAVFLARGASGAAAQSEPKQERARKADTRYRPTEHIRKYYETAMR